MDKDSALLKAIRSADPKQDFIHKKLDAIIELLEELLRKSS
jgi:hypothetical protein